ncbi:hypothetical protein [Actinokineospora inagensis]|uniref:hypothetical protein n=1 Tax=Actinokineospora inagensis TaxID=103730 RepID=UPI001FE093C3|nr:hypothetical protein [Actinokineospora inagensis]
MTAVSARLRRGRDLIDPDLFDRVAKRVAADHPEVAGFADRIVDQALAFVAAAAGQPREGLVPSPLVDLAWHQLVLRTKDYADLYDRVGRFVHHVPDDDRAATQDGSTSSGAVARTIEAISAAGFAVDPPLWLRQGTCTSCHEEGGCRSGGEDGNENSDTRRKPPGS